LAENIPDRKISLAFYATGVRAAMTGVKAGQSSR
jgi:hypothetical protein